ncbi:MAG: hypothetical protein ABI972_26315 [Acidobacteriota bacterium]
MGAHALTESPEQFHANYFNYFTEVEEHFQRARGTGLFLLSPLDWALIETWKNAEIPLEAVLRGIDRAFEKWRAKKQKTQRQVNGLAWCAQAVAEEAAAIGEASVGGRAAVEAPFSLESLQAHLTRVAAETRAAGAAEFDAVAQALDAIGAEAAAHYTKLEELEQRLTALEEKALAIARARMKDEDLFQARAAMEGELRPYRSKFTTDQLARLERQFLDRWVFERTALPRYSIFYVR